MSAEPDSWQLDIEHDLSHIDGTTFSKPVAPLQGKPTLTITHDGRPVLVAADIGTLGFRPAGKTLDDLFAAANGAPVLRAERDVLAGIVRDLADNDPRRRLTPDSEEDCAVCGDPLYDHTDPTCPYLRARAWLASQEPKT